jgi:hypothetical protein
MFTPGKIHTLRLSPSPAAASCLLCHPGKVLARCFGRVPKCRWKMVLVVCLRKVFKQTDTPTHWGEEDYIYLSTHQLALLVVEFKLYNLLDRIGRQEVWYNYQTQ